jgi:hypothetical protein
MAGPSYLIKQLSAQLNRIMRRLDRSELNSKEQAALTKAGQDLATARIYVNEYELSETREEQLESAKMAKEWLQDANKNILAASHIFSAIDVAHLTAQIDQIMGKLE